MLTDDLREQRTARSIDSSECGVTFGAVKFLARLTQDYFLSKLDDVVGIERFKLLGNVRASQRLHASQPARAFACSRRMSLAGCRVRCWTGFSSS